MENIKKIVNLLIELAGAKTAPRTGWQRIGIKSPESLADHAALSGQIAYILAAMEGAEFGSCRRAGDALRHRPIARGRSKLGQSDLFRL